jgi:transcriptional regulator with XRE-family HTH domain
MIALGRKLRQAAQDLSLSDAEVARRAGLTERRYGHYVTGAREPDLGTLARICTVLGTTPNELLGFADGKRKVSVSDKLASRLLSACRAMSTTELELTVIQAEAVAKAKRS